MPSTAAPKGVHRRRHCALLYGGVDGILIGGKDLGFANDIASELTTNQ